MPADRLLVLWVLAAVTGGGLWNATSSAPAQSLTPTAGPQQMVPYGSPTVYPTTYPTTATPAASPALSPALSPYENATPSLMAAASNGAASAATPAMPGELAASAYGSLDASVAVHPFTSNDFIEHALSSDEAWTWQLLPTGLMYKSYLAGNREPRLGSQWVHERDQGWLWDATLGGRVGLLRYGTENDFWPQGWQLDVEGAAFPRLNDRRDVVSNDYRIGAPITTRQGPWEAKFGYYHLCSHIGDEYLEQHPGFPRINYVRDSVVLGMAVYVGPTTRLYYEVGYAFYVDGGAKPWEFQFGADFSPPEPTGAWGAPFLALNGHLRQENDFGGNMTVQSGWQWRGRTGHLCRLGMQYFNGMSEQCQFFDRSEEQIGMGLWYDY